MIRLLITLILLLPLPAWAQSFNAPPYVFVNNTQFVASQLSANFAAMVTNGNSVVQNMQQQLNSKGAIPSGAMIYFNLTNCPTGWTDVEAANTSLFARYIRGIDLGRGLDPTGTAIGGTEANALANHTHTISNFIVSNTTQPLSCVSCGSSLSFTTNITYSTQLWKTSNPLGVTSGANTPYTASLLLCSKN